MILKNLTDNSIYDDLSAKWWEEDGLLTMLRSGANPWRVPFFSQALADHFAGSLDGRPLLDVGCGGGLLAEEFHRLGCRVTGIDLSERSLRAARSHAQISNADLHYLAGSALQLPFPDSQFEILACADVLEHIPNWQDAVAEFSRVLQPGGLFLFDTINRTWKSWLTLIFGGQLFPPSRIFPPATHAWKMFISPEELTSAFSKTGLEPAALTGSRFSGNPQEAASALIKFKLGKLSYQKFGAKLALQPAADMSINYIGTAVKLGRDR